MFSYREIFILALKARFDHLIELNMAPTTIQKTVGNESLGKRQLICKISPRQIMAQALPAPERKAIA